MKKNQIFYKEFQLFFYQVSNDRENTKNRPKPLRKKINYITLREKDASIDL